MVAPSAAGPAALKAQVFVLKEGVDYRVTITFKVRRGERPAPPCPRALTPLFLRSTGRSLVASSVCTMSTARVCVVRHRALGMWGERGQGAGVHEHGVV